jgi:hypothetical protein
MEQVKNISTLNVHCDVSHRLASHPEAGIFSPPSDELLIEPPNEIPCVSPHSNSTRHAVSVDGLNESLGRPTITSALQNVFGSDPIHHVTRVVCHRQSTRSIRMIDRSLHSTRIRDRVCINDQCHVPAPILIRQDSCTIDRHRSIKRAFLCEMMPFVDRHRIVVIDPPLLAERPEFVPPPVVISARDQDDRPQVV